MKQTGFAHRRVDTWLSWVMYYLGQIKRYDNGIMITIIDVFEIFQTIPFLHKELRNPIKFAL